MLARLERDDAERQARVPLIYRNVAREQEELALDRQKLELEQMQIDMQGVKANTTLSYADALERLAKAKATNADA